MSNYQCDICQDTGAILTPDGAQRCTACMPSGMAAGSAITRLADLHVSLYSYVIALKNRIVTLESENKAKLPILARDWTFEGFEPVRSAPFRFYVVRKTASRGMVGESSDLVTIFDNDGGGYTYGEAQDRLQYELDAYIDYSLPYNVNVKRDKTIAHASFNSMAGVHLEIVVHIIPMTFEQGDQSQW